MLMKLFISLLLWWPLALFAEQELRGRVVNVTDGDTVKVLDAARTEHRVRLLGIDAPESRQAYGQRSKQNLIHLVAGQTVTVVWHQRDRYGRIVGKIVLPDGRDANLEQVRAGMAWWYRDYAREQSAGDRQLYEKAENEAQRRRQGLWNDPNPLPPWEFRRHKKDHADGADSGTDGGLLEALRSLSRQTWGAEGREALP